MAKRPPLSDGPPRWWHCDTHGAGKLNAWGCPDCVAELRRWQSTHAPRLDALQGLLATAQMEAHAGREAVATVASERAANDRLTNEIERLRALLKECEPAVFTAHMAQIGTRLAMPETLLYRVRGA